MSGSITDVNDRRCVGGFVRARVRCLGVVRSQSLTKCKKCRVNTRRDEVVAACLTPICAKESL